MKLKLASAPSPGRCYPGGRASAPRSPGATARSSAARSLNFRPARRRAPARRGVQSRRPSPAAACVTGEAAAATPPHPSGPGEPEKRPRLRCLFRAPRGDYLRALARPGVRSLKPASVWVLDQGQRGFTRLAESAATGARFPPPSPRPVLRPGRGRGAREAGARGRRGARAVVSRAQAVVARGAVAHWRSRGSNRSSGCFRVRSAPSEILASP